MARYGVLRDQENRGRHGWVAAESDPPTSGQPEVRDVMHCIAEPQRGPAVASHRCEKEQLRVIGGTNHVSGGAKQRAGVARLCTINFGHLDRPVRCVCPGIIIAGTSEGSRPAGSSVLNPQSPALVTASVGGVLWRVQHGMGCPAPS